jgi:hypothetical protein
MSIPGVYRVALVLYPRRFRREYGADMVALLVAQLEDEAAPRVVWRTALDLLLTVPTRHLEARMSRSSTTAAVVLLVALGVALAVVGGLLGMAAGATSIAVGVLTFVRSRPVVSTGDGRWWKLLLGGAALMATLVLVTNLTGELPHHGWYVAMLTALTALVLMALGLVLGIAGRFNGDHP